MQSLPISSANAANTWWYGNNHNSGTTDPNDPLKWTTTIPITVSGILFDPNQQVIINNVVVPHHSTTWTTSTQYSNAIQYLKAIFALKYELPYEQFKASYHEFDGYVFILENSLEHTTEYLSTKCVMELIYRFFGDPHLRPFPFSDNELTIMYRMPLNKEDHQHIFQVDEDELKAHYKVLSEP